MILIDIHLNFKAIQNDWVKKTLDSACCKAIFVESMIYKELEKIEIVSNLELKY